MEKITDQFIEQYHTEVTLTERTHFTYDKKSMECITRFVLKKLGNSRKILDQFVVKRMCLGLLNAVTDGEDEILFESMFTSAFPDL